MIDRALMYKEQYNEFKVKFEDQLNPYETYKDAEKYLGWRELCVKFTGFFGILNSTKNKSDTNSYNGNLTYLKEFLQWFEAWKLECLDRQSKKYQKTHRHITKCVASSLPKHLMIARRW